MATLSRDEAVAKFGWAGYCRYVGEPYVYERAQVEVLLSAFFNGRLIDRNWDDRGIPTDAQLVELEGRGKPRGDGKRCDPSSRKSSSNPAHSGNDLAYMVDLQRALARSDHRDRLMLTWLHRDAMTHEQIASRLGHPRRTVSEWIDAATSRLTRLMNGEK